MIGDKFERNSARLTIELTSAHLEFGTNRSLGQIDLQPGDSTAFLKGYHQPSLGAHLSGVQPQPWPGAQTQVALAPH